jgi:DNA-binding SARP family transcriptional activator
LRGALSTLRSLLRDGAEGDLLGRDGSWVRLAPTGDLWCDLHEFERLRGSQDEREMSLALELVRGPYLDGDYEDWVLRRRDGLTEAILETAGRLAHQTFARGDFARTAQVLEQALALAPDRQDLSALLFRSWLRLGRPEAVRKKYEELSAELKRDYNAEPSIELIELYHRAELGLVG